MLQIQFSQPFAPRLFKNIAESCTDWWRHLCTTSVNSTSTHIHMEITSDASDTTRNEKKNNSIDLTLTCLNWSLYVFLIAIGVVQSLKKYTLVVISRTRMVSKKDNFAYFILAFIVVCANGLYFHIGETERKCFIEEIPDETTVLGKLRLQLYNYIRFREKVVNVTIPGFLSNQFPNSSFNYSTL